MLATVGEMLERAGLGTGGVVAEELTHNRWLSPGVWRVHTGAGQPAVLKYTNSERSRGGTRWEAHWTARDHEPRRWTYWRRERLYQISESLPRTLCHLDFWPKNLVGRPGGQIVLIDWSFAGAGAVGEDAGNLVPDAVFDHFVAADQMLRLEHVVFAGYLRGLRAGGWDDDPRLVRLGMWSSAAKYDWLAARTWRRSARTGSTATAERARSTPS